MMSFCCKILQFTAGFTNRDALHNAHAITYIVWRSLICKGTYPQNRKCLDRRPATFQIAIKQMIEPSDIHHRQSICFICICSVARPSTSRFSRNTEVFKHNNFHKLLIRCRPFDKGHFISSEQNNLYADAVASFRQSYFKSIFL